MQKQGKKLLSDLLPGVLFLLILLAAPSLPLSWWMYLPTSIWATWKLRFVITQLDIVLIVSLPLWALLAEFCLSGSNGQWSWLLGFWWPQISAFLVTRVVAREASARALHICLFCVLALIMGFVAMECVGLDPHEIFPSYKDATDFALGSDVTAYGKEGLHRIRGFYGESSVLSAALVMMATLVLVSQSSTPPSRGRNLWSLVSFVIGGVTLCVLPFILSKSGIAVLGIGLTAASVAWLRKARRRELFRAALVVGMVAALGVGGYFVAPSSLQEYAANETVALEKGYAEKGNSGTKSRLGHWLMAIDCMARYPLGSGVSGICATYDDPRWFEHNGEMNRRIPNGVYGLFSQWANIGAQTGLYGWFVILTVLRIYLKGNDRPWLRALLMGEVVAFLFAVETFPFLALLPLAGAAMRRQTTGGVSSVRDRRLLTSQPKLASGRAALRERFKLRERVLRP